MTVTRRSFLGSFGVGAGILLGNGCRRRGPSKDRLDAAELATLASTGEALLPDTPGMDAAWVATFVQNRLRAHPELASSYGECARSLEAAARQRGTVAFAARSVTEREAIIRGICSSLSLKPDQRLSAEQRRARLPLNEILRGFFVSDHLGLDDATYAGSPPGLRKVGTPAPLEYSFADAVPDSYRSRMTARGTAIGDYNRAWVAAGFVSGPGVCKSAEEIAAPPQIGG